MQASYRDIIKISFPIIAGSFAQTLIPFTDTAFLGKYGDTELQAIGFVSVYYFIFFLIGFSITKGTQILIARRDGEANPVQVGRIFDNSMAILLSLGIFMAALILLTSEQAIGFFIKDPDIAAASVVYLDWRAPGIVFGFLGSVYLSFYMGINSIRILIFGIVLMSVVNISLNYLLIFGVLGFPEMGMSGAALASNISEFIVCLVFTGHVVWRKLYQKYYMFRLKRLTFRIVNQIVRLSTPIVLQTLIGTSAWMIFFIYVEKMGPHEMQVSSAVKMLYMLLGLPAWGFSTSCNTILSNIIGQGKHDDVMVALRKIIILSIAVVGISCIPILVIPEQLVGLFTDNTAVIKDAVPVLYVVIGALFVYSISYILYHAIISIGATRFSLIIEIITILLYLLVIQWIFSVPDATLPFVWTVEIFYWLVLAILSFWYLKSGHWRKVKI